MTPAKKIRLDVALVERGLAETRDLAQRLIRAGEVRVDDQVVDTPAKPIHPEARLAVAQPPKYVSRGGFKLEGALDAFGVDPAGLVCADVGSSTGGFSDCLLQRGAAKIFALDVGANQLHWKLRNDPRVVVMEKVNVRHLDSLPEPIDLAVIDVSFISLELILPKVFGWFGSAAPGALKPLRALIPPQVIALIKPQFEAGREQVGKGGIVRDPAVHAAVVARVVNFAANQGWQASPVIESPITGTQGNKEFLVKLAPY